MLSPLEAWVKEKTGLGAGLAAQTLEQWQFARLREHLAYAREHSPYYAEQLLGLDISRIRGREDLALLPFTSAQLLRGDAARLLCLSGVQVARITTLNTSGSSGDTKRVYFSERDLQRTVDFFACGMRTLAAPGQTVLILLSDSSPNSLGDLLSRALSQMGAYGIIHGPIRDIRQAALASAEVHCLVGLPTQINRLCLAAPQLRPQSVLLTADYVPQGITANIRQTWGSAVFGHYGLTESGFGLAVQCAVHQEYHLRDAEYMLEIVDPHNGLPLPNGQWGELVLTSLLNEAMPLIRYRTGDMARRICAPCGCGSVLPRLDKVSGRVANTSQTYSIHTLDEALFRLPNLLDYQAQILPDGSLALVLDSLTTYDEAIVRQALLQQGLNPPAIQLYFKPVPVWQGPAKRRLESSRQLSEK